MKGLQFQRLVLISDSKKSANQFMFPKRLNLVTGSDNSIGKSTLVKNLFWSLGCEPKFDQEWKSNDIKSILYFKVDKIEYIVSRYHDSMRFGKVGTELTNYPKITGEFSRDFAKIVGFDLLLTNRENGLDCPPPAYYFLPYYIDQQKSWDEPWSSFESLGQYLRFKPNLIKYFCGYIKPAHFDIEEEIYEQKDIEQEAKEKVERINVAIEIFEEVNEGSNVAVTDSEFELIQAEIEKELKEFTHKQALIFDRKAQLENDIYDLEQQKLIAMTAVRNLDEDYKFAVENVPLDKLECPLCGVEHDNSLLSRAGLLVDKSSLESEVISLAGSLKEKYVQLEDLNNELALVRSEVDRINVKYIIDEYPLGQDDPTGFEQVLHSIAQKNVNNKVNKSKGDQELKSKKANDKQKELKTLQRKLLTKNEKDELNEFFIGNLTENIEKLSAQGVNLNGITSPMDYKKLLGGGAAEGTRGTLAYQLAILRQIAHVNHCSLAPFVIDTPNQQEQAEHRYNTVLEAIQDNVPSGFQVILCGMENEALKSFKEKAHVIQLNGNRLLQRKHYENLRKEYEEKIIKVL